ncbi:MAG: hypothetical protein ACRC6O_08715 [Flavobacterium sp.]
METTQQKYLRLKQVNKQLVAENEKLKNELITYKLMVYKITSQ